MTGPPATKRRRWILTGILIGMFLGALESTVVGTAMPTVIASLGGLRIYSWVFSVYLLTSTVSVPIWGRLSDLYGRRLFYLAGIAIFMLGSVLSGMSSSMLELIVFRAVQGLGAGALVPLGLTIVGEMYTVVERARVQGLFSAVWGIASIAGPVAGGFVTDHFSWRWIFYLNVPFGLTAAAIVGIALEEEKRARRARVDYLGVATLTGSITLFMLVLMQKGSALETGAAGTAALLALSIGLAVLFVWIERRAEEPMLPLALFSNRIFRAATFNGVFAGMAFFGSISFIPLYVQGVMGGTATEAGSVLTPLLLGWVTFAVIGGRLLLRIGYRPTVMAGMVFLVAGFFYLTRITAHSTRSYLTADMLSIGAGMGLSMLTLLIAVQNAVPRSELGIATSATQFFRTIGGTLGVAIMGGVLGNRLTAHIESMPRLAGTAEDAALLADLARHPDLILTPSARSDIPPAVLSQFTAALDRALHAVFWVGLIVSILAFVTAFLVPPGKMHEHRAPERPA